MTLNNDIISVFLSDPISLTPVLKSILRVLVNVIKRALTDSSFGTKLFLINKLSEKIDNCISFKYLAIS